MSEEVLLNVLEALKQYNEELAKQLEVFRQVANFVKLALA
jgi:hypothetical protein